MDKIKQIGDVYALEKSFDNLPLLNMVEAIVEAKKKD
jgi:hypothetical protein